jgi:hypothetical protein
MALVRGLESFLTNREKYVELRELDKNNFEKFVVSDILLSNMGVPQGTVLGPSSFLVHLNDMALFFLIALLILFAEDSNAIINGKNFHEVNEKTDIVNKDFVNFAGNNYLLLEN